MIPPFDVITGNLPPGIHQAAWDEVQSRYGTTSVRRVQLSGLRHALEILREAGCRRAYIDGSFVTVKQTPNDFELCWELSDVNLDLLEQLEPALLDWSDRRAAQKARFGGELFVAESGADPWGTTYLSFFQHDRITGKSKGIVAMDLGELT